MILACGVCGGVVESGALAMGLAWVIPTICGAVGFCVRCIVKKKDDSDCECDCHEDDE